MHAHAAAPLPSLPAPACSGALELVGSVSAGLASSTGVVFVPRHRRGGRLMLAAEPAASEGAAAAGSGGEAAQAAGGPSIVVGAARLMQHPSLLAHPLPGSPAGGSGGGLGRYQAHVAVQAATVLQGADSLRSAHFARGFALQRPVLLVTDAAVVLFAAGGLEAVLVLPLLATGESCWSGVGGRGCGLASTAHAQPAAEPLSPLPSLAPALPCSG